MTDEKYSKKYSGGSIRIGGVDVDDGYDEIVVERNPLIPTEEEAGRGLYEMSVALGIALEHFERLGFLTPRVSGASEATLAKRVRYGGRKGRRALRRLRAKGYGGIWTVNGSPPMPRPRMHIIETVRTHDDEGECDA